MHKSERGKEAEKSERGREKEGRRDGKADYQPPKSPSKSSKGLIFIDNKTMTLLL